MQRRHVILAGLLILTATTLVFTTCAVPAHLLAHRLDASAIRALEPGPEATQHLLTHFGSMLISDGTYRSLSGRSRSVYVILLFESEVAFGSQGAGLPSSAGLAAFPVATDEIDASHGHLPDRSTIAAAYEAIGADKLANLILGLPHDPYLRRERAVTQPLLWTFIREQATELARGR